MKVNVISAKGLETNLNVVIDKKDLEKKIDQRLDEVKKDINLKGFRPGKAPKELLKKQFGQALQGEVLEKVLQDTTVEVLKNKKIKPASQPKINIKSFGENKNLEFDIIVEKFPEIKNLDVKKLKIKKYIVKSEKKDVEERLKMLAENSKKYLDKDKASLAKNGDLVIFDYKALINGNEFENNKGTNIQIILGKDLFIPGFDKQLVGSKKNDKVNVTVNLPQNFPNKELVGKKALFKCDINNIKYSVDQPINDEFAKNFGVKDLNELNKNIESQISNEYQNITSQIEKKEILDELNKQVSVELPKSLLNDEINNITQSFKFEKLQKNKKEKDINKINLDEDEKKQALSLAKRRVKLALALNKIGDENSIKVENFELENELNSQLRNYPGQENNIREYYKKNPNEYLKLKGPLFENKVINFIKKNAKITEANITKEQLKKLFSSPETSETKQKKIKTQTSKKRSSKK